MKGLLAPLFNSRIQSWAHALSVQEVNLAISIHVLLMYTEVPGLQGCWTLFNGVEPRQLFLAMAARVLGQSRGAANGPLRRQPRAE